MATHKVHKTKNTFYFVTFTCHKWLPLFEEAQLYTFLNKSFLVLQRQKTDICGFVIMPNHILFKNDENSLNDLMAQTKRFLSYEIIKRLKRENNIKLLKILSEYISDIERKKGQLHKVFKTSFDAKEVHGEDEICKTLDYIHHNPVSGKWQLVEDFTTYPYSSAAFYEDGKPSDFEVIDFRRVVLKEEKAIR